MKRIIISSAEVDLAVAECYIFPRYWEDSKVNGVEDNTIQMPCTRVVNNPWTNRVKIAWCPIISLDTGQILNWEIDTTAIIHYKTVDENVIAIKSRAGDIVKEYEGYVPDFLCPKEEGYGDYVIMDIDENGFIQDFNNNLDDIFEENE